MATLADELVALKKAIDAIPATVNTMIQQAIAAIPAQDNTPVLNAIAAVDAKIGTVSDTPSA